MNNSKSSGGVILEIDSRLRVVIFKPFLEMKPIDLVVEKKKQRMVDKEKELGIYYKNRDRLIVEEVRRLERNRVSVVRDFDCGPCASCNRDRSVCDDGRNCKRNLKNFVLKVG